jgi:membrane protein DedA with SNARE-associated domain
MPAWTSATLITLAASEALNPVDPTSLIRTFGTIGVLAIVFAETGLLIGFFLPGDSLLFLAGIAASPVAAQAVGVQLPLPVLLVGAPLCAIAGAQVGHHLGARYGRRVFERPNSRFFKPEYVDRAVAYLTRFGPAKAIILARFIAIIRTVINPVAGVLQVPARRFLLYNTIGGVLWTDGVLTQGWPQRPGWRSSTDLLHAETGTKIDLGAMSSESVARCRAAWARLTGRQTCVVHGDPNNPGNVRVTVNRVALIDWDESHVDVPDLDLVLPGNAAGLDDGAHDIAAQASAAWEAAVCWDDEYAVKRLAEVRPV